jgi:uroporphyrinogen-III synthase
MSLANNPRKEVPMSLTNKTIALAEGRQLEDLARMLEQEGATILRCPLVSILDPPDDAPVLAWLKDLVVDRFAYVVLLTGEGLRRLLSCAERHQMRDQVVAALGRTRTITRGPKPVQALREVGLTPAVVAKNPTTEGVIEVLQKEPLQGKTVGVQLYREDNPPLFEFFQSAGVDAQSVLPYLYAPASDTERITQLLEKMAGGKVDVLVFTSSPQVDRLYEVAQEKNLFDLLNRALANTRIAAVGPVVAEDLQQRGARVDICPDQGFVMKNLVQHIKRYFSAP